MYCITLLPGRTHGVDHPEFCYRLRGSHLDEYNAAIRDAAAAEGCRVADVRAFGRDYDSLEGTHPTNLGMRQFASMWCARCSWQMRREWKQQPKR